MTAPVRRRLLNFLTVVSALLCATTCVLWVRSYWHRDGLYRADMSPGGLAWTNKAFRSSSGMIWADVWRGSYLDRSIALYEWQTLQRLRKQMGLLEGASATVHPGKWTYSDVVPRPAVTPEESFGIHYVRTRDQRRRPGCAAVAAVVSASARSVVTISAPRRGGARNVGGKPRSMGRMQLCVAA
jgi:hypothetical protein